MLCSNFKLTQNDIDSYSKKGFLKLSSFFEPSALELLNKVITRDFERPRQQFEGNLSNFKYDLDSGDELKIIEHPILQSTLTQLSQCSLFYTQNICVEMEKESTPDFQWHVGTTSFMYQQPENFGFTLWVPLAKIDNKKQAGGMRYISRAKLSGKFLFDYTLILNNYLKSLNGKKLSAEEGEKLEFMGINLPDISSVLNAQAESDDFELGDALVFDKDVIHCTRPLIEGDMQKRRAFVFRFIQADSTYSLERVEKFSPLRDVLRYGEASSFIVDVCKKDGESIIDSPLFKDSKEKRFIPLH